MSYFSKKLLNNYIFCLLIFHSIYFFLNSIPSMSFLNLHHLYAYINFAYCIPWLLIFHSIYASFMSFFFFFLLLTSSFSSLFFSPHIIIHPTSLLLLPFIFHLILHIIFFNKPFAALPPIYSIFWPQPKKVNNLSISSILFLF